jgi:hypothetical protein
MFARPIPGSLILWDRPVACGRVEVASLFGTAVTISDDFLPEAIVVSRFEIEPQRKIAVCLNVFWHQLTVMRSAGPSYSDIN